LEAQNHPAPNRDRDTVDKRHHPRFKIKVEINVSSRTCGLLRGHTVDISESGVSALLKIEVPLGELVQLEFPLPFGQVRTYAMVRQQNAFRYGFQFVVSDSMKEIIRATCVDLAVKQSLWDEL
jgi:PilZ domain